MADAYKLNGNGTRWRNRIVGYGMADPSQLLPNELNPKIHPKYQQDNLASALGEIGWIQDIVINKRTGEEWPIGERNVETMLDGHARTILAIRHNETEVPIKYVDLTPNEERLALLTLDPIGRQFEHDAEILDQLLREVNTGDSALQALLADMAIEAGITPPDMDLPSGIETIPEQWAVMVQCRGESEQFELLQKLESEGYTCRALIS